ncbi:hypothetical protein [Ekhidna sp.]
MKKSKAKKKFLLAAATLFVGVAVVMGFWALGKNYADEILNELVKRESKGFYKLSFESLDLDIFERRITINHLKLNADSSEGFENLGLSNIYEIELGQLLIDFKSIIGFYIDKELEISNVRIVDPNITMMKLNSSEKGNFSLEAGNLYQAISDYMEVLKIDYFRIQDGSLAHHPSQFKMGNIDFVVQNLMMDSLGRVNSVFYSESIELEIRNQKFFLPDDIHTITFDSFLLSTKDSILRFKNFQIMPLPSSEITFTGNNDVNVYQIQVPELLLKGVDYVAAYQESELKIKELILTEPTVFIDDETHADQKQREDDNSILSLLFNVFNSLEIGKLTVDDAHIDLKIDGEKNYQRIKAEETNLIFHKIRIDSSTYRFDTRNKYFEDIELDVHNYRYFLPDSVHVMSFDLLKINSINSDLLIKDLGIAPSMSSYSNILTVALELPSLEIHGIDYRKAFLEKHLSADTISVLSTGLELFGESDPDKQIKVDSIYQTIQTYFKKINIQNFILRGSSLALSEDVQIGGVSLIAKRVDFNSETKFWSQIFGDINLEVNDFNLLQDSIKVYGERMGATGNLENFYFENWRLNVGTENQKINGTIDSLLVHEVNIDSVLQGKVNYFKKALIIRPDITFRISSSIESSQSVDHIEKELVIVDASLKGILNDIMISVDSLSTDVFVGDSTAFRSLDSRNIDIRSSKFNHLLKMSRLDYVLEGGEMDFHDILIAPMEADSNSLLINAFIPMIGLKEFEQSRFFDDKVLSSSELIIQNPLIDVFLPKEENDSILTKDSVDFVIDLASAIVLSGNINLTNENLKLKDLKLKNASLELTDVQYPNAIVSADRVLYSTDVNLHIEHLKSLFTSKESMDLHGFRYNTNDDYVSLDSILFESKEGLVEAQVYETNIVGLDANALYNENAISLESLTIMEISGKNEVTVKAEEKGNFEIGNRLDIQNLSIKDIDWTFSNDQKEYNVNDGYLEIEGVESNDTLTTRNISDRIHKLKFGGSEFVLAIDDGYRMEIDSYELRHPEHSIDLNGIKLKSRYTKEEYSDITQYQNDWFDVFIERTQVKRFDLSEFINHDTYQIDRLNMEGVDAFIYRDKAVPFDENQSRKLPQSDLRDLDIHIQIDTIHLSGDIVYQEKVMDYEQPGEISFNELDVDLLNIKTKDVSKNGLMILSGDGKLMNAGSFEIDGIFNLSSSNDQFSLGGKIENFPLDSMNRMLVPVANVRIDQGIAKQLFFNFIANDTLAQGEMKFKYNDLRIQLLNAQTHEKAGLGAGLKTFFANTFVVRNRNPSFLFLRKGIIFQKRDTSKAIFNYWSKALLSGAVSSVGIHKSDKQEKKFEKKVEEDN